MHWQSLSDELPKKLTSLRAAPPQLIDTSSDSETDDLDEAVKDIIQPFSELKVDEGQDQEIKGSARWRSELRVVDVWYASYGSNMWKPRFLCYIEGGQVEGMQKSCSGSMDKTPPKHVLWKIIPHRLFFGHDNTKTWGPGGVAFLHPESNAEDKAYICMYRVTLEQFNDVLFQENGLSCDADSPLFDLRDLDSIKTTRSVSPEAIKRGWYHNVVLLDEEQGIPILTMTCDLADVEGFKSGKVPLRTPAKEYANTLIRGLSEGKQLSQEEATTYIDEATSKPL